MVGILAEPLDLATLENLSSQLVGDDHRLVTEHLSEEALEVQNDVCPVAIPHVIQTLHPDHNMTMRSLSALVLTHCTMNHPNNRKVIGMSVDIFQALKQLLEDAFNTYQDVHKSREEKKEAGLAMGRAAEAVWILAFAEPQNGEGFLEVGIIDSLVLIVNKCHIDFLPSAEESLCSYGVMWSLAALQNLAATYCSSESGRCQWEWLPHGELKPNPAFPATSGTGHEARQQILPYLFHKSSLSSVLTFFVCQGPVDKPSSVNYPWPGQSKIQL